MKIEINIERNESISEVDFFVTLKKEDEQSNIEQPKMPKNLASLMNPETWQRDAKAESEKKEKN